MKNENLGKFQVTKVANGFVLSVLNPKYKPGQEDNTGGYVAITYIAQTLDGIAEQLVTHLVTNKLEQQ